MDEALKTKIIIILAIVSAVLFIGMVGSCGNAGRQKNARDKEMATRLDLEEKVSKFAQEKAVLNDKINSLTKELEAQKAELQETKKSLVQEQLIGQSLKDEMQKVTKVKEALENDLKDAINRGKSTKNKK